MPFATLPSDFKDIVLYGKDEVSVVASFRDLYISFFDGPVTAARLAPCFPASRALQARYPDGYVAFNVVGPGTPTSMDRSAREAIDDLARANRVFPMRGDATVIEATGFVAAAARAVLTSMQILSGRRYPRAVFPTIEQGAAWAAPFLRPGDAGPISPEAVVAVLEKLLGRRGRA
jgi:hypothetical protein